VERDERGARRHKIEDISERRPREGMGGSPRTKHKESERGRSGATPHISTPLPIGDWDWVCGASWLTLTVVAFGALRREPEVQIFL